MKHKHFTSNANWAPLNRVEGSTKNSALKKETTGCTESEGKFEKCGRESGRGKERHTEGGKRVKRQ